ncbi:HAMP domain-containing histidine kinase [Streptococcus mitis]|nr:HAMP domain-containing sensor histidine kinase [Streptococcus sp. NLN64]MBG9368117.1 HAMP domain-containing histidine kinase [Streptococcus sp. NLN64]
MKPLLALGRQIESLFQRVEQTSLIAMQEKQTLDMAINNISHDIRTPLTVASGYTQLGLRKEELDRATLEKIANNLFVVSNRLEALMEYRRLMEGVAKPQLQKFDLSQEVTRLVMNYYDVFRERGIDLDLRINQGIQFEADPEIIGRLCQNLLGNILKHGKTQARLSLSQTEQGLELLFSNQVQQPIQHLDQLTSRFYSENMSDTEESSGLGLYICQQLTQLLGGDMRLSTEGDWFSVQILL